MSKIDRFLLWRTLITQMTHLFVVTWVTVIPTHGVLLSPGVTTHTRDRLKVGDTLELHRPDGTVLQTSVAGFYQFTRQLNEDSPTWDVLLAEHTHKDDIPVGTEVLLVG